MSLMMINRKSRCKKIPGLIFLFLTLYSCNVDLLSPPPYLITGIRVINGPSESQHIASLHFSLLNRKEYPVASLDVGFQVFDLEGNHSPGCRRNRIDMTVLKEIPEGGEGVVEILLDPLFSHAPLGSLTVSEFSITSIKYADGSVWKDYMGLFRISSEDVVVEEL